MGFQIHALDDKKKKKISNFCPAFSAPLQYDENVLIADENLKFKASGRKGVYNSLIFRFRGWVEKRKRFWPNTHSTVKSVHLRSTDVSRS